METINHECYVSLEVAKLLKEAGFDWSCREYYPTNFMTNRYEEYEKPTLDVAQKWLREVKRIFIHVSVYAVYAVIEQEYEITDSDKFSVWAETWDSQSEFWNKWTSIFEINDFNTYEEALEAGIKKCLTILLEEKKS